jgi:hypothetical protein
MAAKCLILPFTFTCVCLFHRLKIKCKRGKVPAMQLFEYVTLCFIVLTVLRCYIWNVRFIDAWTRRFWLRFSLRSWVLCGIERESQSVGCFPYPKEEKCVVWLSRYKDAAFHIGKGSSSSKLSFSLSLVLPVLVSSPYLLFNLPVKSP